MGDCQQGCQLVLIVMVVFVSLIKFFKPFILLSLALLDYLMLPTVCEKTLMLMLHWCQIRLFNGYTLLKTDACGLGIPGGK